MTPSAARLGKRRRPARLRAAGESRVRGEEMWWPPKASSAGVVVDETSALRYPALLATFAVLSGDVAVLPLHVYKRAEDGSRETLRTDPRVPILSRTPDGITTPIRWRSAWVGHALQYGNGYAEIQRLTDGTPYRLHLLDPRTTRPTKTAAGIGYRNYHPELGNRVIASANVLHLAGFGFDGLSGYNFVRLLETAVGLGLASQEFAAEYFGNGAEPGGVIEVPTEMSDVAYERMRKSWREDHGFGSRHSPAILEQGAKWTAVTSDPEKTQLGDARRFQVEDATRPWRVPPNKYGNYRDSHYNNVEAANTDYLMTALIGWLEGIEQELNLKLFTETEWLSGLYVEHDVNALLRGDLVSRFNAYHQALEDGWMNRNEVRRRENLNPIPADEGGDKYLVQLAKTTLDQAGAIPPPPATNRTTEAP